MIIIFFLKKKNSWNITCKIDFSRECSLKNSFLMSFFIVSAEGVTASTFKTLNNSFNSFFSTSRKGWSQQTIHLIRYLRKFSFEKLYNLNQHNQYMTTLLLKYYIKT